MSNPLNGNNMQNFGTSMPMTQLKNILTLVNAQQNPQAILQQVAQKNPQMAQVMQLVQGRNPQEVFYDMCKQKGVDPESILSQLR